MKLSSHKIFEHFSFSCLQCNKLSSPYPDIC